MGEKKPINRALKLIAQLSVDKASNVLSKMIKTGAKIELERVHLVDITEIATYIMENDRGAIVGAFVDLVGDAPFKFLFYVRMEDSLILADMMLRKEVGTTKEFNLYASSAVQELGNVLASAISNVFSSDFQIKMKPTPPIVVNDFEATVFQEYIMSSASERDEILIIESVFNVVSKNMFCRMFILPMEESDKILSYLASSSE